MSPYQTAKGRRSGRIAQRRFEDAFGNAAPKFTFQGRVSKHKNRTAHGSQTRHVSNNRDDFTRQHFADAPHSWRLNHTVQRPIFEDTELSDYFTRFCHPGDLLYDLAQTLRFAETLHRFSDIQQPKFPGGGLRPDGGNLNHPYLREFFVWYHQWQCWLQSPFLPYPLDDKPNSETTEGPIAQLTKLKEDLADLVSRELYTVPRKPDGTERYVARPGLQWVADFRHAIYTVLNDIKFNVYARTPSPGEKVIDKDFEKALRSMREEIIFRLASSDSAMLTLLLAKLHGAQHELYTWFNAHHIENQDVLKRLHPLSVREARRADSSSTMSAVAFYQPRLQKEITDIQTLCSQSYAYAGLQLNLTNTKPWAALNLVVRTAEPKDPFSKRLLAHGTFPSNLLPLCNSLLAASPTDAPHNMPIDQLFEVKPVALSVVQNLACTICERAYKAGDLVATLPCAVSHAVHPRCLVEITDNSFEPRVGYPCHNCTHAPSDKRVNGRVVWKALDTRAARAERARAAAAVTSVTLPEGMVDRVKDGRKEWNPFVYSTKDKSWMAGRAQEMQIEILNQKYADPPGELAFNEQEWKFLARICWWFSAWKTRAARMGGKEDEEYAGEYWFLQRPVMALEIFVNTFATDRGKDYFLSQL